MMLSRSRAVRPPSADRPSRHCTPAVRSPAANRAPAACAASRAMAILNLTGVPTRRAPARHVHSAGAVSNKADAISPTSIADITKSHAPIWAPDECTRRFAVSDIGHQPNSRKGLWFNQDEFQPYPNSDRSGLPAMSPILVFPVSLASRMRHEI